MRRGPEGNTFLLNHRGLLSARCSRPAGGPTKSAHHGLSQGDSHERGRAEHEHPQVPEGVGVSSQREIEHAVARAVQEAAISGTETFPARMTLEIVGLRLKAEFDGEIRLEPYGPVP
jgi:hypothetical protein